MFEFFGRVMMCIWWLCRQCWDVEGATVSGSRQRTQQNKPAAYQDHPTWSNLIQLDPTCPSGIACSGDRPDLLCYTLAGAWPVFCREIVADCGRCVDSVSNYSIDQIKSDEISIEIQLQSQARQVLHFQISLSSNTSENRGTTRFWFFFVLDHVHHPVRLLQEADKVEDPARSDSWKYLEMLRISVSMCVEFGSPVVLLLSFCIHLSPGLSPGDHANAALPRLSFTPVMACLHDYFG